MLSPRHFVYSDSDNYPTALLIKGSAFDQRQIESSYLVPMANRGLNKEDVICCSLLYNEKGKAPVTFIKEYLAVLMPLLAEVGTKHLYCADANYFKVLTSSAKAEPHLGYILKCTFKGYEHLDVILGVNHTSLIYNPANEPKMGLSIQTLCDLVNGTFQGLGQGIIKDAHYPANHKEVASALLELHKHPSLVCDTETFSLDHDKAGLGTIGFAWSKHEGISFACDYKPLAQPLNNMFGEMSVDHTIRDLVKNFLTTYQGEITYHNATFDIKILIAALWMEDGLDTNGLLTGLEILTRSFQDTKIIAYLALNSTAYDDKSYLGLKNLAHMFAGNWGKGSDIKDIRRIPLNDLLEYNLVDCLCTYYVKEKYYPYMVADKQEELYYKIMLPSQKTIIQTELTGMPLNPKRVLEVKQKLEDIIDLQDDIIYSSPIVRAFNHRLQKETMAADNAKLKVKQHPIEKYAALRFNASSPQQKVKILYEEMNLPVIDLTPTKQPAVRDKTLSKLINHTTNVKHIELIEAMRMRSQADKILGTFIKAFLLAVDYKDGVVYLHGNFNLGGAVSGRLSSSNPNLQNLPSRSIFGPLIKECFQAPKGWIFAGADFNALEDYISALTTKDPNKMKVYLDGYDGHCLRAFSYFPERLPGINNTVESINSIKKLFPEVRDDSKAVTFLLTYGGTAHGLMNNLGFEKELAQQIEKNYHELYKESDKWVKEKLKKASNTGYVEVAFGLRVRTPLLSQTIRDHRTTPFKARGEGRTAGNALGQSYGLLNNRAANDFMQKVWASPYRFDVKPVGLIHDAIYLLIRDDINTVEWVNTELIKSMQWQELPEIAHDTVKLGAELDLFWPSWNEKVTLINNSTPEQIKNQVAKHRVELAKEGDKL